MLCLFFAILPPAILAGVRDASLGRDWFGYGIDIWNLATNASSLAPVLGQYPAIEPGYKILNYIVGLFSSDCHAFFFIHQLILVTIAVAVAYKKREHHHSEFILLFYFLYMFNTSMTIIRQSIALMLCLLAYSLWDSQFRKKSYACLGFAVFFHVSAVFAFFMYVLSKCKNFLQKHQILILILVLFVTYNTVNSFTFILTKLIDLNIFSWHYIGYADQVGDVSIHKTDMAFQFAVLLLAWFLPSKIKNKEVSTQIFFLSLTAISLNMFGNITDIAFRVAHYFILPIAVLMPRIAKTPKSNRIACLIFAFLLLVRFLYFAHADGLENTVPYKSAILGI